MGVTLGRNSSTGFKLTIVRSIFEEVAMLRSALPFGPRVVVRQATNIALSLIFLWIMLLNPGTSWASPSNNEDGPDQQTVKMLLQRIEQLEADQKALQDRVAQLESEKKPGSTADATASHAPAVAHL